MNASKAIERAVVAGYQRLSDWILEQRITFANRRLRRCTDLDAACQLFDRLAHLVRLRSPGQVRRMEARKGLR